MQLLYDSDNFAVVQFEVALDGAGQVAGGNAPSQLTRSGFELVDKLLGKEIFLEGAMAQSFKEGVDALIQTQPSKPLRRPVLSAVSKFWVTATKPTPN